MVLEIHDSWESYEESRVFSEKMFTIIYTTHAFCKLITPLFPLRHSFIFGKTKVARTSKSARKVL